MGVAVLRRQAPTHPPTHASIYPTLTMRGISLNFLLRAASASGPSSCIQLHARRWQEQLLDVACRLHAGLPASCSAIFPLYAASHSVSGQRASHRTMGLTRIGW